MTGTRPAHAGRFSFRGRALASLGGVAAAWMAVTLASFAGLATAGPAQAQAPVTVTNTAQVQYDQAGQQQTVWSNTDTFQVVAPAAPVRVRLLRYAAAQADITVTVGQTWYSRSASSDGPFAAVMPPSDSGRVIPISDPVPLAVAQRVPLTGSLFVEVTDAGANRNPGLVEQVLVTTRAPGDEELLQLQETGPDTGVFVGWVQVSRASSPTAASAVVGASALAAPALGVRDGVLTLSPGASLTVFTVGGVGQPTTVTALAESFGTAFSSATGAPLNGVRVTLVDAVTGLPAAVRGEDGVTPYPSTIVTGSTVSDQRGVRYDFGTGEFWFPWAAPGTYRVVLDPPAGYRAPSTTDVAVLQRVSGGRTPLIDEAASRGQPFVHPGGAVESFDTPLDPDGPLQVEKVASRPVAAPGEVVFYRITVRADASGAAGVAVIDDLAPGSRYRTGSARLDGAAAADPLIVQDGRELRFDLNGLAPNQSRVITYAVQITAGARAGEAVNRAYATDAAHRTSNLAVASVQLRNDLFRTSAFLVGRVTVGGCEPGEPATPLAGVRVYLEDGTVGLTDADGRYSFEGLTPGVHVVRLSNQHIDPALAPARCGRSRGAWSRLVDLQGGILWRADFRLALRPGATLAGAATAAPLAAPASTPSIPAPGPSSLPAPTLAIPTLAAMGDAAAASPIASASPASAPSAASALAPVAFVSPEASDEPSIRSMNLAIRHPVGSTLVLSRNGQPVAAQNRDRTDESPDGWAVSRWRGVDLDDEDNLFVVVATDTTGREIGRASRTIHFGASAATAVLVRDESVLVADGVTEPVVVFRLTAANGRPARPGTFADVRVEPPHALVGQVIPGAPVGLTGSVRLEVQPGGLVFARLAPAAASGRAVVTLRLAGGEQSFPVELRDGAREWMVVGLATASVGENATDVPLDEAGASADQIVVGDRVAFFARGPLGGGWQLRLAYDSERDRTDESLFRDIAPSAFFPTYGDHSLVGHQAQSSGPLFVRLENDSAAFTFGDYDAALLGGELTSYRRRLYGFNFTYDSARFGGAAFASRADTRFVHEELPSDMTSGLYRLQGGRVVINSELVTIETRDRFRAGFVKSRRTLARHVDYEIDYEHGEIFLNQPPLGLESGFDPLVVVVEYEAIGGAGGEVTYGGRVQARLFGDGRVGVTAVHENDRTSGGDLVGADVELPVGAGTRLRAEVARTRGEAGEGNAYAAELRHQDDRLSGRVYVNQQDPAFGLGRRGASLAGVSEVGAEGELRLDELGENTRLHSQVYRRDSALAGGNRTLAEITLARPFAAGRLEVGLRHVQDVADAGGADAVSDQILVSASRAFLDGRLRLRLAREQTLDTSAASLEFPTRTVLAAEYDLRGVGTVFGVHEELEGRDYSGALNRIGLRGAPWAGADFSVAAEALGAGAAGGRLSTSYRLGQTVQLRSDLAVSADLVRQQTLTGSAAGPPATGLRFGESAFSPDFTAASLGVTFTRWGGVLSARAEVRDDPMGRKQNWVVAWDQAAGGDLQFGGRGQVTRETADGRPDQLTADARIGLAYRPNVGAIVLSRLDLESRTNPFDVLGGPAVQQSTRLVNNTLVNFDLGSQGQLAIQAGWKVAWDHENGSTATTFSQLYGLEYRRPIGERFDIGFRASALRTGDGSVSWALGPSIGMEVADGMWASVGYNLGGFDDPSFAGASSHRSGAYVQFRARFDETTVRDILDRF